MVADLSKADNRKWWSCTNGLMGWKQNYTAMGNLANQVTRGDEEKHTNSINELFQSVSTGTQSTKTGTHSPASSISTAWYLPCVRKCSGEVAHGNWCEKAPGQDGIPNWVLRDFTEFLSPLITAIFNSSFNFGKGSSLMYGSSQMWYMYHYLRSLPLRNWIKTLCHKAHC